MRVTEPTVLQCAEIWLSSRQKDYAENTLKRNRTEMRKLVEYLGASTKLRDVYEEDIDDALSRLSLTVGPAVYNNTMSSWGAFFRFCLRRGYRGDNRTDPMGERRYQTVPPSNKRRVPLIKFQSLLDATDHPRDRMIIALGLYLFLRQSEMVTIKIGDVNLNDSEISVIIHKTNDRDIMPICEELDVELRRYLTWYTEQMGVLDPDWYLVPSRYAVIQRDARGRVVPATYYALRPTQIMTRVEDVAKAALEKIGHPVKDKDGKGLFEGIHTLRRSGARALFDELRSQGIDGALQRVRAYLHHASVTQTEKYIGLNVERVQRNEAFKGKQMFTVTASNVVPLGGRDGATSASGM